MSEIKSDSQVVLHYAISLEDGTVVDSTREDDDPINFNMQEDVLIDGLKQAIVGLKSGDKKTIVLSAEESFGFRDTENIHLMPRSEFSDDMELEPGVIVGFETAAGDEVPGMVIDLNDDEVTVDFNHPLAGHQITFDVEVIRVDG